MMSDDAPETAPLKPKKSRTGLGLLALGLVNLGGTAFLAFRVLTAAPAAAAAAHDEPVEAAAVVEGPVIALDPFVVNLKDEGMSRYLKTSFELELADRKAADQLGRARRVVRDELLRYLSGLAVADTLGEEGKQRIQDAVVARLGNVLGDGKVRRVFFTDFVVQ
jgi:flagellar FliL protein